MNENLSQIRKESHCCRICLETKKTHQMKSIFEESLENDSDLSIPQIVFILSGIEISELDRYPTVICRKCSGTISVIRKFREQCLNSDIYFKNWMECREVPKKHSDIPNLMLSETEYQVKEEFDNKYAVQVELKKQQNLKKRPAPRKRQRKHENSEPRTRRPRNSKGENTVHPCSFCGKVCRTPQLLYSHERTHMKKPATKDFNCDLCGKDFSLKIYLYAHMINIHVVEKKYKCDKCPQAYSRIDSFKNHVTQHLAVKPFACNQCPKTFGSNKHYQIHLRGKFL